MSEGSMPTPEENQMEVSLNLLDVAKIDLEPGDVLVVKCKGKDFEDPSVLQSLQEQFKMLFPYNKIAMFFLGDNEMNLEIVKSDIPAALNSCSGGNYCSDCTCGKKEQAESEKASWKCENPKCGCNE